MTGKSQRSIYVATASAEPEITMAERYIQRLERVGFVITHDWTKDIRANAARPDLQMGHVERQDYARKDFTGIRDARIFWLLVPAKGVGSGCWVELGYALSFVTRLPEVLIVSGDWRRSIFCDLVPTRFDEHERAFDFISTL
jgi:hypothetical protein